MCFAADAKGMLVCYSAFEIIKAALPREPWNGRITAELEDKFFIACFSIGVIQAITLAGKKKVGQNGGGEKRVWRARLPCPPY